MRHVLKIPIIVSIVCMAVSVVVCWMAFAEPDGVLEPKVFWFAALLPMFLAFPASLFVQQKQFALSKANEHLETLRRELTAANELLKHKAERDYLTGLSNRETFTNGFNQYLAEGVGGTLLFVDVDNFKTVNDTYGHNCGDDALKLIAHALQACVRPGDLVGRHGGEEFVIYLKELTPEGSQSIVKNLRRAISEIQFCPTGIRHPLSVSLGGAWCDQNIGFVAAAKKADTALYSAKANGRNCYNFQTKSPKAA